MLKAIETKYKGYRFRSRLEARWAVFFDTLGITWEYEKEGYNLGAVGWYLPDFWLPQVSMWAEVKPEIHSWVEIERCKALAQLTKHDVVLLDGMPDFRSYFTCGLETTSVPYYDVILDTDYINEHRFYSNTGDAVWPNPHRIDESYADSAYIAAVYAARSARFEHGETPKGRV